MPGFFANGNRSWIQKIVVASIDGRNWLNLFCSSTSLHSPSSVDRFFSLEGDVKMIGRRNLKKSYFSPEWRKRLRANKNRIYIELKKRRKQPPWSVPMEEYSSPAHVHIFNDLRIVVANQSSRLDQKMGQTLTQRSNKMSTERDKRCNLLALDACPWCEQEELLSLVVK
jgi:hypothetical protein